MNLIQRILDEMISYAEGYNDCNKMFRKYLKKEKTLEDAIKQMDVFVSEVNAIIDREVKNAD